MLRCDEVSRVYGSGAAETQALSEVSLALEPGELVVLRGPSGSGKTTLVNVLGGLDRPTSGTVHLGELELTAATEAALVETRRRDYGFVFQSFALLPMLSAAENVEVPLRLLETPARQRDARVRELLALVGLAEHAEQRPYELSGGQQQRVGIARALANRPRVLLADEPTGQLDSGTAARMVDLLVSVIREDGVAALITTHDPKVAERADRVLELHGGHLGPGLGRPRGRHAAE
ncbi:MAG: ABC transporter ATP-binding protein [Micrococcales bacterium]|nr:ABC transporter ATP-binding protein [Micrococcales bacterium]